MGLSRIKNSTSAADPPSRWTVIFKVSVTSTVEHSSLDETLKESLRRENDRAGSTDGSIRIQFDSDISLDDRVLELKTVGIGEGLIKVKFKEKGIIPWKLGS